jgi:hypothetical protein
MALQQLDKKTTINTSRAVLESYTRLLEVLHEKRVLGDFDVHRILNTPEVQLDASSD